MLAVSSVLLCCVPCTPTYLSSCAASPTPPRTRPPVLRPPHPHCLTCPPVLRPPHPHVPFDPPSQSHTLPHCLARQGLPECWASAGGDRISVKHNRVCRTGHTGRGRRGEGGAVPSPGAPAPTQLLSALPEPSPPHPQVADTDAPQPAPGGRSGQHPDPELRKSEDAKIRHKCIMSALFLSDCTELQRRMKGGERESQGCAPPLKSGALRAFYPWAPPAASPGPAAPPPGGLPGPQRPLPAASPSAPARSAPSRRPPRPAAPPAGGVPLCLGPQRSQPRPPGRASGPRPAAEGRRRPGLTATVREQYATV
nr:vegetative cell wall protein gp1-like [Meriones unguiculatus]